MLSFLAFIFVIGLLVTFHEFGHFIFARLFGIKVLSFSIGYGPPIFSYRGKETEFSIRLLPLGGFVKMAGIEGNPIEGYEEAQVPQAQRFDGKPIWQRILVVLAGPLMNIVLSILLVFIVFLAIGVPAQELRVIEVIPGGPADRAGLQAGDIVLQVNGKAMDLESFVSFLSQSAGKEIELTIQRRGETKRITVVPEWDEDEGRALVRAVFGINNRRVNPLLAFGKSTYTVINWFLLSIVGLLYTLLGRLPLELTGPLGIAQMAGQAASLGFLNLLMFSAIISVFLAIFNLLPIPLLDGGHLLLFLVEKIRGKPLEQEKIGLIYLIGILFIFLLAVFVTYQDVMRIVVGD
ncbi:RIP metalloprotease RseP [Atrimonas thermophila]|uniref:RIP metalloprotease RseP n=1 Tax=Atrimonas thermophila TaxID=3064161 RepID=UPI00399C6979